MDKFFRIPFAFSGDKTAVPDAFDSNGNVSYEQGYGFDYQRQKTDPAAKNIERDKMNQIFFDLTNAVAEIQARGIPDFITPALNGDVPFSYEQNVLVRYSGAIYISLTPANTADPTDTTKWALFPSFTAAGAGGVTRSLQNKARESISVIDYGALGDGVADDTIAISNATSAAQAGSGEVYFPKGQYRIASGNIPLANVTLRGCGVPEKGAPYTDNGSVILLDGVAASPFALGRGVTLEGLSFFWPGQNGVAATPTVFPPLFAGTYVTQFLMQNCTVVNAYQLLKINTGGIGAGDIRFDNCRVYAVDKAFWFLNGAPDVIQITNSFFSFGVYEDVANVAPYYLRTYTANNGEFMRIDCGAGSQISIDGLQMSNTLVFGPKYGIRLISGALDVSFINGCSFDAVSTVLAVEGTAIIRNTSWTGNLFYCYNIADNAAFASAFNFLTTGAVSKAQFTGNGFAFCQGSHFLSNTTGISELVITGNSFASWGQTAFATPQDHYAIGLSDSGLKGTISGNTFKGLVFGSNNPNGINATNIAELLIVGNQFGSCYVPVQIQGGTKARVYSNTSTGTGFTQSLIDSASGAGVTEAAWNSWDKNGAVIAFPSFQAVITGAQTFTGAKTQVQFGTEVYDQDANYDPATHTFTAPVAGTYSFDLVLTNTTGVTAGDHWNATIERAGGAAQTKGIIEYVTANQVGACSLSVSAQFVLAAGDTIKAYLTRGAGTGNWVQLGDAGFNYFQGRRIQ